MSKKKRAPKTDESTGATPGRTSGATSSPSASKKSGLTRRGFLGTSAAAGGVALTTGRAQAAPKAAKVLAAKKQAITLNVNGQQRHLEVEPRITLLRALRNELDITGPKEICDRGACGGCSVHLDG